MTSRERELAAIKHQVPDRIPIDAICIENLDKVAEHLQTGYDEALDYLGIDGRIIAPPYTGEIPVNSEGMQLSEWRTLYTGDYGTEHPYPLSHVRSIDEIEQFPWPDPDAYNYAWAGEYAAGLGDRYALRGPYWRPIFCQACDMLGMEEAMVRMAIDPMLFEAILDHILEVNLEYYKRLMDACGESMPIFCLGDDFATQRGLMISPESWRKFLKPRFAAVFAEAKKRGKFIWFHSCGDITSVLPDLIDIGIDVWETVQLHTLPMTAEELKREYGRHITFFGGINTQNLPFARPDQVRDEVKRCIEVLGEGGGYICGPDHHIKPDVSVENTLALFETAVSYRGKGCTKEG